MKCYIHVISVMLVVVSLSILTLFHVPGLKVCLQYCKALVIALSQAASSLLTTERCSERLYSDVCLCVRPEGFYLLTFYEGVLALYWLWACFYEGVLDLHWQWACFYEGVLALHWLRACFLWRNTGLSLALRCENEKCKLFKHVIRVIMKHVIRV